MVIRIPSDTLETLTAAPKQLLNQKTVKWYIVRVEYFLQVLFKSLNRSVHTLKDIQKTMTGVDGDPVWTQTESHSGNL